MHQKSLMGLDGEIYETNEVSHITLGIFCES